MKDLSIYGGGWTPDIKLLLDSDVGLFIDGGILSAHQHQHQRKIAYCLEPVEIIGTGVQKYLLENYSRFDLILTDQTPLLQLPNSKLFIFAAPSIHNRGNRYKPTHYGVSTVVGNKVQAPGHRLRHELWAKRNQITIPKFFYSSKFGGPDSDLVLGDSKLPLFDAQFHIAIENSFSDHYISEKLTDCFQTRCVPIYVGAKNVCDIFDIRGMFVANNIEDVIDICNSITPETYDSMQTYIDNNYAASTKFIDWYDRIKDEIKK